MRVGVELDQQLRDVERRAEDVGRTGAQDVEPDVAGRLPVRDENRCMRGDVRIPPQEPAQLGRLYVGQRSVDQDCIGPSLADRGQGGVARCRPHDAVAPGFELTGDLLEECSVRAGDQDDCHVLLEDIARSSPTGRGRGRDSLKAAWELPVRGAECPFE